MGQTDSTHFGPQPEWVGPARFPAILNYISFELGLKGTFVIYYISSTIDFLYHFTYWLFDKGEALILMIINIWF